MKGAKNKTKPGRETYHNRFLILGKRGLLEETGVGGWGNGVMGIKEGM